MSVEQTLTPGSVRSGRRPWSVSPLSRTVKSHSATHPPPVEGDPGARPPWSRAVPPRGRRGRRPPLPRLHQYHSVHAPVGGVPGRAGSDGLRTAAARARHALAGHAAHRLAGLVRRGGPGAAGAAGAVHAGVRLRAVDGRCADPAPGRPARGRRQRHRPGQPGQQGRQPDGLRPSGRAALPAVDAGHRERHRQAGRRRDRLRPGPDPGRGLAAAVPEAGRHRTAAGDAAGTAAAQQAGPRRVAGRLDADPRADLLDGRHRDAAGTELPRRDVGP